MMPEHMPRIRKRINYTTKYPLVDAIDKLNEKLEDPSYGVEGQWISEKMILNLADTDRQFWSPRMKFIISPSEDDENFGMIRGFVEPQPFLWKLFLVFYIAIGLPGILGSIFAFKKFRLEGDPQLLWVIPATLLFLASSYWISNLGQQLMNEQIDTLDTFLRDIIEDIPRKTLVKASEITPLISLKFLGKTGDLISQLLLKLTGFTKLNQVYSRIAHLPPTEFIAAGLETFQVKTRFFQKDLDRIPRSGGVVFVSNHPTTLDGLVLPHELLAIRPDLKVLANFLLQRIEPLQALILPVNPFEEHKDAKSSLSGLKAALKHVKMGGALVIFPAGEISMLDENGETQDREWQETALKLIRKMKVPVVPVYLDGKNSPLFYFLARLSGSLRTALLGKELLNKKNQVVSGRIGKAIYPDTLQGFASLSDLGNYLRTHTYWLKKGLPSTPTPGPTADELDTRESIDPAIPVSQILQELETCKERKEELFSHRNFSIFLSSRKDIPHIVEEIGRLREETFRSIGEGSGKSLDLDRYDDYYKHLFLFDNSKKRLVGAYRLGIGKDISARFGTEGFYLSELFEFDAHFKYILSQSIDMGRAFICCDYQRSPMGLYLLWKGISTVLLIEKAKYLIGGVSISNAFSPFSKKLLIHYLKSNYYDDELAQHLSAKCPYTQSLSKEEEIQLELLTQNDIQKVDQLLDEIEPYPGMKMPVLFKKYLKQNGKLIAFNIDPDFNSAVDGLMIGNSENFSMEIIQSGQDIYQQYIQKRSK